MTVPGRESGTVGEGIRLVTGEPRDLVNPNETLLLPASIYRKPGLPHPQTLP
jgi:hypothetical protein